MIGRGPSMEYAATSSSVSIVSIVCGVSSAARKAVMEEFDKQVNLVAENPELYGLSRRARAG